MFSNLQAPPVDTILALAIAFKQDTRPFKIDLGIGVYKDHTGATPVMRSVKAAEKRVWEGENSKSYLGLGGDEFFARSIQDLVLGSAVEPERVRSIQTVGGGAAVRLLSDLLAEGKAGTVWIPSPTWINHVPIAKASGLLIRQYTYLNRATSSVAFDQMMDELSEAKAGDVILLHGCCHNPTGADLSRAQWGEIASLVEKKGLLPFVDIAYQGFGDGLEADAAGLQLLAQSVPEMVIATSCSKNFGVYRDRVGTAVLIGEDAESVDRAKAVLLSKGRINYSFPANHGAATVAAIFADKALFADWRDELEAMRVRMMKTRISITDGLKKATRSDRFGFIKQHKGMFSLLPLTPNELDRLRDEFAIFMPPDGRMNVAAVKETDIQYIGEAFASIL